MGYFLCICVRTKRALEKFLLDIFEKCSLETLFQKSLRHIRQLTFCCCCNRLSSQFEKFGYLSSLNHFDLKVAAAWPVPFLEKQK